MVSDLGDFCILKNRTCLQYYFVGLEHKSIEYTPHKQASKSKT